jgi:peptidoglycan/xylan/chitin deacetylase (PgdA/CDA1 family)
VDTGHEVGCHTFDHIRIPAGHRTQVERSILRNRQFLRRAISDDFTPSSFAFPYGDLSLASKWQIQAHYPLCRWILPEVNRGTIDLGRLGAFSLESRDLDMARIEDALDEAVRCNGWVIFFTHDVSDAPTPYGCPTSALEAIVAMAKARNIDVLPVKDAAAQLLSG